MSPTTYKEQDFEGHIAERLVASGYRLFPPIAFDRDLVLLHDELLGFIRDTQPAEYDRLRKHYGDDTDRNLCLRISKEIGKYGALHVLRKGVKDRGVKLRLVYFRPASDLNPEHLARYRKNRFAVVRQLMYSKQSADELDLALFVNRDPGHHGRAEELADRAVPAERREAVQAGPGPEGAALPVRSGAGPLRGGE